MTVTANERIAPSPRSGNVTHTPASHGKELKNNKTQYAFLSQIAYFQSLPLVNMVKMSKSIGTYC